MIEVVDWEKHQHYKTRTPPWIKLHRKLLTNPIFLRADGDAVKILTIVWLVASENHGIVEKSPADLAFVYPLTVKPRARSLIYWHDNNFLKCASNVLAWCKQHACLEEETETEGEGETDFSLDEECVSADQEAGSAEGERPPELGTSSKGKFEVRLPDAVLREEALVNMGLGQFRSVLDVSRVNREMQDLIHKIDRENLLAAMRGFKKLRDAGELHLTPGKGYTPGILLVWCKQGVWWGEGDQRTQRNFLDLCQEIGRQDDEPANKNRGGMDSTGDVLRHLMGDSAA